MIKNIDPFIISEIGINHNGKLKDAYKLIDSSVSWSLSCKVSNL